MTTSPILTEGGLTTAAAARYLNQRIPDSNFSPVTVWRWMQAGAIADDGQRVFLEHVRAGRKLVTSREALDRFVHRLTSTPPAPLEGRVSPKQVGDATASLAADGFFE
ncbi:MAG TPA: hypothetical protein VK797_07370 [Tepidisphaeraceae bacterium]|jgi:hypothetical protein|nr:hypothetical protein [Tepidisphaeraceae bacterium]